MLKFATLERKLNFWLASSNTDEAYWILKQNVDRIVPRKITYASNKPMKETKIAICQSFPIILRRDSKTEAIYIRKFSRWWVT